MVLFRFILILLLIYFLVNLIRKMLFPNNKGRRTYSGYQGDSHQKREGEVNIQTGASSHKKRIDKDDGEYVKFEEISDDKSD